MAPNPYTGPSIALLKNLPPEAYKTIPFEQPPLGVTPNFENPPTRVPVILGVSITYLVISSICLSIRIYMKTIIVKKWRWDDVLVFLGYLVSIVYFSGVVLGCRSGGTGRHGWDVYLDEVLGHAAVMQCYICTIMSNPALGLIKMSLFTQYYFILGVTDYIRKSVYIIGTLTAVFYIAMSITAFILNSPWRGESLFDTILSWHFLKFAEFAIPLGVVGMLIDLTLFVLPIPAIWSLNISHKKKLGAMLIFMTGALGVVASILSLYYRALLENDPADTTWKVGYTLLWTQVEMWSGVTASCMPSVKQFFSNYVPKQSPNSTLEPTLSHIRQPAKENMAVADSSFRRWGYKSNGDVESATHIVHGSPDCADLEMEDLVAEGISHPREAHVDRT